MQVQVAPPNPKWTSWFRDEELLLRDALHDIDYEIHHIGSTAIPGIFAKPVIDILLLVQDLELLDFRNSKFRLLGYESMGEFGIPERRYFRKDSPQGIRTHQVHSFTQGSLGATRHLAFRDYMKSHTEAANAYSLLKQNLASSFPDNMQAYIEGKDEFVKQHEDLALTWISHIRRGA